MRRRSGFISRKEFKKQRKGLKFKVRAGFLELFYSSKGARIFRKTNFNQTENEALKERDRKEFKVLKCSRIALKINPPLT